MKWLKSLFAKRQKTVVTVVKQAHELTLEEWRRTPNLVLEAKALFKNQTFLAMLEILKVESPINYVPTSEGTNPTSDLQTLGQIRGYHRALNNIESFATPLESQAELTPTFAPETESEQT